MRSQITQILLFTSIGTITRDMFGVVFNLYLRENRFSNQEIGSITSFMLWGSAIVGLVLSLLAETIGRKRVLFVSAFLFPIFNLGMILIPNPGTLNALSFFRGGIGVISQTVVSAIIVHLTESRNRAKVFGLNIGLTTASAVLGNLLGGFFGEWFGLREALYLSTGLYCLSFIPLLRIKIFEVKVAIRQVLDFSMIQREQKNILTLYYLSTLSVGFGAGLFIHFGNLIYKDLFGLSSAAIGIALSIADLGTSAGNIFSHVLARRVGPLQLRFWCELLVVPLMISLIVVRQPALFVLLYTLRYILMNSASPILSTIINSFVPKEKIATLAGINTFLNNSIRGVAAMLFGIIVGASLSGYNLLFSISTAFYALNAVFSFLFLVRYRRHPIVLSLYPNRKDSLPSSE
ncbi:MAG TPA: MFS transporter [Thermotogota bacterium]|jgi:MFS family permease|nr:MFS transporter [Thermotogota bacterium]NLH20145.1 MFS transporter [Thermotogaceae bacterium]OQC30757.1 MAG: putative transporter [Thermotogota bacterium ADurb.Bin062]HNY82666.1 MFS transporter [Thermotogota bacterium]HOD92164.1 MFS transporter [Thermotogota bacterium]